jgi:hypothetical protein
MSTLAEQDKVNGAELVVEFRIRAECQDQMSPAKSAPPHQEARALDLSLRNIQSLIFQFNHKVVVILGKNLEAQAAPFGISVFGG